jgi:hypothetical protein
MRSSKSTDAEVEDLAGPGVLAAATLGAALHMPRNCGELRELPRLPAAGHPVARSACCGPAMRSSKSAGAFVLLALARMWAFVMRRSRSADAFVP